MRTNGVRVFISYRRESGREIARNIYERLTMLGYSTFFDYDSMRNGMFNHQIYSAIDQASDFILILTNGSLERCNNEGDWVREEIEYALKSKKNIILLAPEGFEGFPEKLPEAMASIKLLNILFLSQNYYEASIQKLTKELMPKPNHFLKWALGGVGLIVLLICFTMFFGADRSRNETIINNCSATLYLMRYTDLNLKENSSFSKEILDMFHYEDSIGSNGSDYYIYPVSKYINYSSGQVTKVVQATSDSLSPFLYHNPVIRLKLKSSQNKTLVFNAAYIEIESYRTDDSPFFRFMMGKKGVELINEGWTYWKSIQINYSWLSEKESFTTYKSTEAFGYFEDNIKIIPLQEKPFLTGVVELNPNATVKFEWIASEMENLFNSVSLVSGRNEYRQIKIDAKKEKFFKEIEQFNRSLVKGEIDDDFYFRITSDKSCSFSFRLRLEVLDSSNKQKYLYSNYIHMKYSKPRHGICFPNE